MDRLKREANPPVSQLASPIPQYKTPGAIGYEAVEGQHGAPFATLKDASGAVVSPATEAKLEQVRALLSGVATEDKLEQARVLLNTISTKDFATQTTLAAVLAKLEQLETEIRAVKANQVSGDQKVQLSGTIEPQDNIVIGTRAIRDSFESFFVRPWDVPALAKGVIITLVVYGVTGTFDSGEGYQLELIEHTFSTTQAKKLASTLPITTSGNRSGCMIKVYPGIEKDEEISYIDVPTIINNGFRALVSINGTFLPGEGIDCEVQLRWLY